jgi:hypothetical protein
MAEETILSQESNPKGNNSGLNLREDFFGYRGDQPAKTMGMVGTPSNINRYAVFRYHTAAGKSNKLYDIKGKDKITEEISRNPSAAKIIDWSAKKIQERDEIFGSAPYDWSDFLYCRYYGRIPNNYMITLRRFPLPVLDGLRMHSDSSAAKIQPPIAQALTWMGEETGNKLSDLLKFAAGLNWKEVEADVQKVFGNEQGNTADPLNGTAIGAVAQGVGAFFHPDTYSGAAQQNEQINALSHEPEGPYANQVYGPVNVISKTFARERGLHFEQEFKINFHYSLQSFGNVNPKIAMLDILGNLLSLGYNNAKFWGGAIRYFPGHPNLPFIGGKEAQDAFHRGDVGGYLDAIMSSKKGSGGLGEMKGLGGDLLSKLLSDPIGALKELVMGGAKVAMAKSSAENRPNIVVMKSLLTGEPIGEWHLVIGNPMNPVAMIGNLIVTDLEIEFGNILGADDFPTEMTATYTLKHAMPRDKGDIESMFNLGSGRLYYSYPEGRNWFDPVDEKDNPWSTGKNSVISNIQHEGSNDKSKNTSGTAEQFDSIANKGSRAIGTLGKYLPADTNFLTKNHL